MSFDSDAQRRWYFATHPSAHSQGPMGAAASSQDELTLTHGWEAYATKKPWVVRTSDGRVVKRFDSADEMTAFLKDEKAVWRAVDVLPQKRKAA